MDVPWRVRTLIIQSSKLLDRIGRWEIKHILRLANEVVDDLARDAMGRANDLLWGISETQLDTAQNLPNVINND
ncbi:Uncharacterized protein TCM_018317 [Theobroma cacao]|uniref:RNase H type-1 domain-containing protein n=1 Tax=Theobroma cacao TaxID=3641 RepID=A0A061EG34_THECC|nr:Uncharacterized protein TCM_018317 [Theobroma cacao]